MTKTRTLNPTLALTAQITHKWTKEITTRKRVEWVFLLLFLIISWVLFVMVLLGWRNLFGLVIGDGSFGTFISPLLLSFVFYLKLAIDKNTTIIRIFSDQLTIETAPITTPGRKCLLISELKQMHVVEKASKFGRRVLSRHYEIYAVLKDGKMVSIFPIRLTKEEAQEYLVQIDQAVGNRSTGEKLELA